MKSKPALLLLSTFTLVSLAASSAAKEFHVSPKGDNASDGTIAKPLKTISAAAGLAQPGDVITVHAGTYRERINPPRGGTSDTERITYQAAKGEEVHIKGSEIITGWKPVREYVGVWKVTLPNSFFGNYNPYADEISGDWFRGKDRAHHTGEVFLNGRALFEKASLEELRDPKPYPDALDQEASTWTWYCEVDDKNTTIWANFHGVVPNIETVEINLREACFYPDTPGRDYITVRGFHMSQAATQWAAPTAEQPGLLGTHWSKGWIIENNVISNSRCVGITLGKERATGHNVWLNDPSKGGADHYNEVVVRALDIGWSKENIGSHIVRNNTISHCGAAGICGSLGAIFSTVTGNHIHDIWAKRQFTGAEMAGIKFHAAIDSLIQGNHIHRSGRGIWLDWMTQGTRVTQNLLYENSTEDLFVEVNHGPFLVDNNIFLSPTSIRSMSEGGAYAHNLIGGDIISKPVLNRETPYHPAHSTRVTALSKTVGGDARYYNNLFVGGNGLTAYEKTVLPMHTGGNLYVGGVPPFPGESQPAHLPDFDAQVSVLPKTKGVLLAITIPPANPSPQTKLVTTDLLGKASVPDLPYVNPDDSPLTVDRDYFGKPRDKPSPAAGPFEGLKPGETMRLKVIPRP